MKKVLFGTSALVAAGLLSGGAMAADPVSLGISGFFGWGAGYVSEDDGVGRPGNNDRNHAFAQDTEVIFSGSSDLDNGTKVTVQIELEGDSVGDQIDENFIRFSNDSWGTIEMGGRDGPAQKMLTLGPAVDFHHIIGTAAFSYINAGTNDTGGAIFVLGRLSDSYKVSYYTPRMGGFQIGVGYEPEPGLDGGNQTNALSPDTSTTAGSNSEFIEVGLNYVGDFGDASVRGGIMYAHGNQEGTAAVGPLLDDQTIINVGAQVGYGSVTVGGAYQSGDVNHNAGAVRTGDDIAWRAAVSYSMGAWLVGAGYAKRSLDDETVAGGQDEATVWGLTAKRTLGPGITGSIGLRVWSIDDDDNAPAAENDATNIFVSTRVGF